jgi:hypothetical protein
MLADQQVQAGIIGHAVALVRGFITSRTPDLVEAPLTSAGMSENSRYCSTGCQIGPSVKVKPEPA